MQTQQEIEIQKIDVADFVRSAAGGRTVSWIANRGNAGDSMIAAGTAQMFRKAGVEFEFINEPDAFESAGKIVCFSGGGNLVPFYTEARHFLKRHHHSAERLIILPHTVDGHADVLAMLGPNVTIICREARSFAYCRRVAAKAEILAADDLAISLAPKDLLEVQLQEALPAAQKEFERLRSLYLQSVQALGKSKVVEIWRIDSESLRKRPAPPRYDIPDLLTAQPSAELASTIVAAASLLRFIANFETVRTDRLHAAIAGAILGRTVELYPGSYFKNRAVYDFSLRAFPRVKFVQWE